MDAATKTVANLFTKLWISLWWKASCINQSCL